MSLCTKTLQSGCPTEMNSVIISPPGSLDDFLPTAFCVCVWKEFPSLKGSHSVLELVSAQETSLILLIHAVKRVKQHFLHCCQYETKSHFYQVPDTISQDKLLLLIISDTSMYEHTKNASEQIDLWCNCIEFTGIKLELGWHVRGSKQ